MKSKSIDNIMKYIKYLTLLKKKRKTIIYTSNPLSTLVTYFCAVDAHRRNECALVTICAHV